VPVVPMVASKNQGFNQLLDTLTLALGEQDLSKDAAKEPDDPPVGQTLIRSRVWPRLKNAI